MSQWNFPEQPVALQVYRENNSYAVVEEQEGVLTLRNRHGLLFQEPISRLLQHGYRLRTEKPEDRPSWWPEDPTDPVWEA
jgi:hypothetical protein